MGGVRMVEEVEELELGDGLPKGKLPEPFYGVRMNENRIRVGSPRWVPWLPLYKV
jgi:hypothetical protein